LTDLLSTRASEAHQAFGGHFEARGVLIEIISGEGGDDSKLFAEQLFIAYLAYLDKNGIEAEIEETGPSKFSFVCEELKAESLFDSEQGCHCVQRCPKNDRSGRKHTSYIAVVVTRLHNQNVGIKECDLEESFQRGHGKGGQHQNKTSSAVRLKHKPTGLEVFINGRSQQSNRRVARLCLSGKVKQHITDSHNRTSFTGSGRGDKIRTYNFSDSRITDHRNGAKCHRPEMVMKEGRFELLK
jgi:peptide chain release factor 1